MAFLKKIRLFLWITKAFLNKHGRIIFISSVIGIIGFFLVYRLFPYLPSPKKHEKIAKVGRYDPDNLPKEILKLLSMGLTTLAEDGQAMPGLAKSWRISDDGLSYTFILADNLFWQDEIPVKADQINYNFTDVEQEVLDEKTIKFKLKEPFPPFLVILSKPVFKVRYLGVGPYKIKKIKKTANLVEKVTLSGPEKNISFRFYHTEEAAFLGFKLGEVNVLDKLLFNQLDDKWKKNIEIEKKIAKDRYLGLFFNIEQPMFSDKSIRQALAYSIVYKPTGEERATGPINPLSWAYNPDVKLYPYDPAKAKDLFKKSEEGKEEPKEKIKISTTEHFLEIAEKIKKSWEEALEIDVDIELINVFPQDYQVFLGI